MQFPKASRARRTAFACVEPPAGVHADGRRAGRRCVEVAQAQAIAALFQAAHWDWNDPLSARAFERGAIGKFIRPTKWPGAEPQAPSEHLTRIRTVSADGEVEAASITLNTGDYDAVSERLEFRDREWVELSEIAEIPTENAGGSGART